MDPLGVLGTDDRPGWRVASEALLHDETTPAANGPAAEREVWLVLGQSLSVEALKADTRRRPPPAEALQVYSLSADDAGCGVAAWCEASRFCSP